MPEYVLMALCLFILTVTGVLKAPCAASGLGCFRVCYMLAAALALSVFEVSFTVEVSVNIGAAAMVFLPALVMERRERGGGGVMAAVVLFSITIALLCRTGALYGAENGVLCGLMAGVSAILLADCPADAAFCACAIPAFSRVVDSFLTMAASGYASFELGVEALTAQLVALPIVLVIIWAHGLGAKDVQAE